MREKWTITEHDEYKKTIRLVPRRIKDKIENELKPRMEQDPFTNAIQLRNKLEGFYEQKQNLESYRVVFRILDYNSKKVEFSWVRAKPHVTAKHWIP
jgi:mRNA-degrading endonuclease RelE of RelBE toxin-antitoxin system